MGFIKRGGFSLGLMVLAFVLAGCSPKKPTLVTEELAPSAEDLLAQDKAKAEAAKARALEVAKPALEIASEWRTVPQLKSVHFDHMKANLTAEALEVLKANAVILKAVIQEAPLVVVRLEGHCDDRGTLEYNLALGQRRANALRTYYGSFGLPKESLLSISYGEEKPVCGDSQEECWRLNRRGETTLKSSGGSVRILLEKL
jgi:peptidoglycan-associated lipoprotein